MKRMIYNKTLISAFALGLLFVPGNSNAKNELDFAKEQMVKESIAEYPKNCPCPYNRTINGSLCGKRSAYSRPNGYEPLCYVSDISDESARQWLEKWHKSNVK